MLREAEHSASTVYSKDDVLSPLVKPSCPIPVQKKYKKEKINPPTPLARRPKNLIAIKNNQKYENRNKSSDLRYSIISTYL
jgi:hypothetical protein